MDASDRRRRAAREAAEWWVVLQDDVSRSQREQFVDWLRESAVHVSEMLRVAQVHGALAQFERWAKIPTDGSSDASGTVVPIGTAEAETAHELSSPRRPSHWRLVWGVAASLVLLAGLFLFLSSDQVIQTERGDRREVALADGSVLQVDPETRLRVDYEAHIRRVFLERGRALFRVAKNAKRPFVVMADATSVRAVGTAFAVEQGQNVVVVTVQEGHVAVLPSRAGEAVGPDLRVDEPVASTKIDSPSFSAPSASPERASSQGTAAIGVTKRKAQDSLLAGIGEIVLGADEQITVEGSGAAEPVREIDSHRALAWAEGRLVFENDTVEHAVREFNRYNRIRLTVGDAVLAQRTISGVFSAADPESFVAFIQSVATVRITRDDASDITIGTAR
jgi:transmembrane sensor